MELPKLTVLDGLGGFQESWYSGFNRPVWSFLLDPPGKASFYQRRFSVSSGSGLTLSVGLHTSDAIIDATQEAINQGFAPQVCVTRALDGLNIDRLRAEAQTACETFPDPHELTPQLARELIMCATEEELLPDIRLWLLDLFLLWGEEPVPDLLFGCFKRAPILRHVCQVCAPKTKDFSVLCRCLWTLFSEQRLDVLRELSYWQSNAEIVSEFPPELFWTLGQEDMIDFFVRADEKRLNQALWRHLWSILNPEQIKILTESEIASEWACGAVFRLGEESGRRLLTSLVTMGRLLQGKVLTSIKHEYDRMVLNYSCADLGKRIHGAVKFVERLQLLPPEVFQMPLQEAKRWTQQVPLLVGHFLPLGPDLEWSERLLEEVFDNLTRNQRVQGRRDAALPLVAAIRWPPVLQKALHDRARALAKSPPENSPSVFDFLASLLLILRARNVQNKYSALICADMFVAPAESLLWPLNDQDMGAANSHKNKGIKKLAVLTFKRKIIKKKKR